MINPFIQELKTLGIKPKKSLGQNFLVNSGDYGKIIGALGPTNQTTILEVGPGLGWLTDQLADTGAPVVAE